MAPSHQIHSSSRSFFAVTLQGCIYFLWISWGISKPYQTILLNDVSLIRSSYLRWFFQQTVGRLRNPLKTYWLDAHFTTEQDVLTLSLIISCTNDDKNPFLAIFLYEELLKTPNCWKRCRDVVTLTNKNLFLIYPPFLRIFLLILGWRKPIWEKRNYWL